ncbi:transposase, partial [Pseudomonas fluorescens]
VTIMARRPRLIVPEVPLHIIQRGNNRGNCFFSESDYMAYLSMLKDSARVAECKVHAYVLMSNHVHLLVTPSADQSAGKLMKYLG